MANNRSETFVTPEAIMMYPHLLKKSASTEGGKETFNVLLLFPKTADITNLKNAVNQVLREAFPNQKSFNGFKNPIHDGADAPEKWGAAFKDSWYIRVSTERNPVVIDAKKQDITNEDEIYSGQYARAAVSAYAYNVNGNRGVAFGFSAIQITRDGARIGRDDRSLFDEFKGEGAHVAGTSAVNPAVNLFGNEEVPF